MGAGAACAERTSSIFGAGFATDVIALTDAGWTGPVASSFGLHLVRVDTRIPGRMPELDEVRPLVERAYATVQRTEASQLFLERLREQYQIEIRE